MYQYRLPFQYSVTLESKGNNYNLTANLPEILLNVKTTQEETIKSHLEVIAEMLKTEKRFVDVNPEIFRQGFEINY